MSPPPAGVTTLLGRAGAGDPAAAEALYPLVEAELRRRAEAHLRRAGADPALQATVLIDDAFLKLVGDPNGPRWESRAQFYAVAARAMRQVLVDAARRRNALKRGGGGPPAGLDRVPEPDDGGAGDPARLLALHDALDKLAAAEPRLARVVELHHFGGWDLKAIAAEVEGRPYHEVRADWHRARAWVRRELGPGGV